MAGRQVNQERSALPTDASGARGVVAIRYGGRRVGLYRVKQVGEVGMLLNHGGISFPVGTRLDVGNFADPKSEARPSWMQATVVDNTPSGLRLAWCRQVTREQA